MSSCSVYECQNKVKARGFCSKHYRRLMRHGDVNTNYHRKYRKPDVNFKFDAMESKFIRTSEESLALRALFGEEISIHEGQDVYYGNCLRIDTNNGYRTHDYDR